MNIDQLSDEQNEAVSYAEIVLYDVLDIVFKNLNVYDLNQASKVCKSWYYAAKMEKLRRGPQVMILQALEDLIATGFSNVRMSSENIEVDDFKVALRIKPKVGLFFTDGKHPASADCDSVPFEICSAHQWTQPESSFYIAVEALGVGVNDELIGGEKNVTAGVFLPDLPSASYAVVETSSHHIERCIGARVESTLNDIVGQLFADKKGEAKHVCFMIFIYQWKGEPTYENHHNKFLAEILDNLRSRYEAGTFSLWGAAINDIFALSTECAKPLHHSTSFCALKVSGSFINSWSIVISVELPFAQIIDKLQDFKRQVRLRSSSLAFLILPAGDEKDINQIRTQVFQSIFPNVHLISLFNDKSHAVISVNSMDCDQHQDMKHFNCFAYLIITYK